MLFNKTVLAICCAVLIGIGGCSRQQSDWQKTREANSTDAYEQFLKKYPSGEFTAQAQARLKEMSEQRDWEKARDADTPEAYQAFLKQYPEGKWTEEARIRVENFTLAQTPAGSGTAPGAAAPANGPAMTGGPPPSGPAMTGGPPPTGPAMKGGPPPGAADEENEAPPSPQSAHKPRGVPPPAASSTQAPGESGRYAVQLGAFKTGHAAAKKRWEHLQKEYPKMFAGLSSKVLPKKAGGGTLYRLQVVDLTESHAQKICKALKAKSPPCVIIRPDHGRSSSRD
jgi:cell division protein FtsN